MSAAGKMSHTLAKVAVVRVGDLDVDLLVAGERPQVIDDIDRLTGVDAEEVDEEGEGVIESPSATTAARASAVRRAHDAEPGDLLDEPP